MALAFTDSFASYAATADLANKWPVVSGGWTWNATAGRSGGPGLTCAAGSAGGAMTTPALTQPFGIGFYVKLSQAPSSNTTLVRLLNNVSQVGAFGFQTNGYAGLFNSGGTLMSGGISRKVCDNEWHFLELKAYHGSVYYIYVDAVLDASYNSLSNNPPDKFQLLQNNAGMAINGFSDLFVYDNNTGAPLASSYPIGPRMVTMKKPNGDSAVQFTRSSGDTNYSLVNETVADGDSTYVEDGTSGHQDLYDYEDLGFTPAAITSVMAHAYVKNPGAGSISAQQICKNTNQTDGASFVLPASYGMKFQPFPVDPATSAAWTQSGLDAAKFGIKVP